VACELYGTAEARQCSPAQAAT